MKIIKSVILLLAVGIVLPTLCACGDDDNDSVVVNGFNLVGLWTYGWEESDFEYVDVLYSCSSDGTGIAYASYDSYPLINGILQCSFSDFHEELRATWSITKDKKTISVAGFALTITKKISNDEAEAINWWGDKIIIKRIKGFTK